MSEFVIYPHDDAKHYLVNNVMPRFTDTTFKDYIHNRLAGDFAYQIAMVFAAQEEKILRLQEAVLANTSRKAFKEDGRWFSPLSDAGAAGAAAEISKPESMLYEALLDASDREVIYRWRFDAQRDWSIAASPQWLLAYIENNKAFDIEIEAMMTGRRISINELSAAVRPAAKPKF